MTEIIKTSEILRAAKYYMWDGHGYCAHTYYLCTSIQLAAERLSGDNRFKAEIIKNRISKSIAPENFVSRWLENAVGVPVTELTCKNLQAYRHRWLDALIAEYEAKED
jgi:hypothetical protein